MVKSKGWKKIYHANSDEKIVIVALPISDKEDFQTRSIIKDKHISNYKSINPIARCKNF